MNSSPTPWDPIFTRGDVAEILNISTVTIANREKANRYPAPRRDLNNYRVYSLMDVLNLQLLTYSSLDPRPIISVLYDKGLRNKKQLGQLLDTAMSSYKEQGA